MLRVLVLIALILPAAAPAASWTIAPETEVGVDVTWRGLRVTMRFPNVAGTVEFDASRPEEARARITVASRDVRTGLAPADRLARSPDYLAAEEHPAITFVLDRLVQTSRSTADIFGDITFRGVTRPIRFRAQLFRYGPPDGEPGRLEAGFRLTGAIDRTRFGSTGGLPEVAATLPIRIRLVMVAAEGA